jgi:hypothetical protein
VKVPVYGDIKIDIVKGNRPCLTTSGRLFKMKLQIDKTIPGIKIGI